MIDILMVSDDYGLYAKGHHDKAAFVEQINAEYGAGAEVEKVSHCWLRYVPDSTGEYNFRIHEYDKPSGRGSFPATMWWIA